MSLQAALTGIKNAIVNNYLEYTTDNCSIGDEAVFGYIQSTVGSNSTCAIVEYAGFTKMGRSEFRATTIEWHLVINVFFMIIETDYITPLNSARAFVDSLILLSVSNPTLSNSVQSFQLTGGSEPLSYRRGNYDYVFVTLSASVLDNISG